MSHRSRRDAGNPGYLHAGVPLPDGSAYGAARAIADAAGPVLTTTFANVTYKSVPAPQTEITMTACSVCGTPTVRTSAICHGCIRQMGDGLRGIHKGQVTD